jgi:hypothetical protein
MVFLLSQNEFIFCGWLSSALYCLVVWYKFTDVSDILAASITRGDDVNFYEVTRRYNPEENRLHTHRRENLKL